MEQGFSDREYVEDENALGLGLKWPGPYPKLCWQSSEGVPSVAVLPKLETCKSVSLNPWTNG